MINKMLVIRKVCVAYLIVLSVVFMLGLYNLLWGQDRTVLGQLIIYKIYGLEMYVVMGSLIFLGFMLLWGILIHRNILKHVDTLFLLTLVGYVIFIIMYSLQTTRSVDVSVWISYISFVGNSLFGAIYFSSPHD